jgi:hypothetical protein
MNNYWQTVGVRYITEEVYTEHIYGQTSDKPWLLFFGKTPYGGPDGDFDMSLILFKRVVCTKIAFGDALNVGLVDVLKNEFVR